MQVTRRNERKGTRLNTLRNTLTLATTNSGYINLKKD